MRVAQIVLPGASEYERKCQRIDAAHIEAGSVEDADLAHVYGRGTVKLALPFVASFDPPKRRFQFRKPATPRFVVSPLVKGDPESRVQHLPEAVEDEYFDVPTERGQTGLSVLQVGCFKRASVESIAERAMARITRVRDDVNWRWFDAPPSPADLHAVDAWVDPAVNDDDYDGFVAEAIVSGKVVIASRTPINMQRMEKGRTGFLVPCNDPNELSHAILGALFKSEVARLKIEAARSTAGKFRARQRLRVLERIYEATVT